MPKIEKMSPRTDGFLNSSSLFFSLPILYFFFLGGYIFTWGFFGLGGALALFIIWLVYLYKFFSNRNFFISSDHLRIVLLLSSFFCILLYGVPYQVNIAYALLCQILFVVLFIGLLFPVSSRSYLLLLIGLASVFILTILSSPNPKIDTFDTLKLGGQELIQGKNPYASSYTKLYADKEPNYYAYPPATLLLTLPSVLFLRDPRYMLVFFLFGTAFFIGKISNPDYRWQLPLLFLFNPMTAFIVEESYIEPMIIFLLTLSLYLLRTRKYAVSAIIIGLLLAAKQYSILFIPFIFRLSVLKNRLRLLIGSTIVAVVIISPFFLWNTKEFISDVLLFQAVYPARYDGLTFFSLLYRIFHIPYASLVSLFIIGIIFFMLIRKKTTSFSALVSCLFFFFFTFFYFNKWAFVNYYYFISSLLILVMAFKTSEKNIAHSSSEK